MLANLPSQIFGVPSWAILFGIAGFMLFFWKITGDNVNQDSYPTIRFFLFLATIFVAIIGVADFVRWSGVW